MARSEVTRRNAAMSGLLQALKGHDFSRAANGSNNSRGFSRGGMVLKPAREHATNNAQTYFVTSDTWERRALFRTETWARLFFKTLLLYRGEAYLLHEFVLMPDHFHLLITPFTALEKSVQLIKGGFSFQAKKELGSNAEIWHRGFADHRIRDFEDYDKHVHYIHLNPAKKHLCASPVEYRYSSAYPGWKLDPIPQGLKPEEFIGIASGTAKAEPFQSKDEPRLKFQDPQLASGGAAKARTLQSERIAKNSSQVHNLVNFRPPK